MNQVPGAYGRGDPFKITSAVSIEGYALAPGEISIDATKVLVGCAKNTTIELLTVVPAGKKEMIAADWARGARLQGGEKFWLKRGEIPSNLPSQRPRVCWHLICSLK
jgi:methionyl-tRNA formyltransferase